MFATFLFPCFTLIVSLNKIGKQHYKKIVYTFDWIILCLNYSKSNK